MITERLHIRRKDRDLKRREVLAVIARMRQLRDQCRRGDHPFERGQASGLQLAAEMLWSEYENGRS